MKLNFIFVLLNICLWIFLVAVAGYVVYLVIKALRKYTRSAPSTTNLMALAKVFDVSAEELLKEIQKN